MEFKAALAVFLFISHSISPYKGAVLHLAQGGHGIECITVCHSVSELRRKRPHTSQESLVGSNSFFIEHITVGASC